MQTRLADGKGNRNWKNDLRERARKETLWFRPDNVLLKSFLESEAGWRSDQQESSNTVHPKVQTVIWQKISASKGRWGQWATQKHHSIAAAPEWTFEQINFVAGRHGAVVEDNSCNKLERLSVQAGKMDKILAAHVQRICEAHGTVIRSWSVKWLN